MKKIVSFVIAVLLVFSAFSAFCIPPITVQLNGVLVPFDQEPQIINDRTFVPVRAILESMGASVNWNESRKTVTTVKDEKRVVLTIGKNTIYVNGHEKTIDAAPQIIGGRTLIPVRAVSENFDCAVNWDEENRRVIITAKDFSKKLRNAKNYKSPELLTHDSEVRNSVLSPIYLDGCEVSLDSPDGTCIDLSYDSENYHAHLNLRRDVYIGVEKELTPEYVEGVANEMVNLVSGTLSSYDVVTLNGIEFMKIDYSTSRTVSGIDDESMVTVYMTVKNGVMYTVTLSLHGNVERVVLEELMYTVNSIKIS